VPEGVSIDRERLWRVFVAWISMKKVRSLLNDEELEGVFKRVEERVWMGHKRLSSS
jgi:hypothetical protein